MNLKLSSIWIPKESVISPLDLHIVIPYNKKVGAMN